MENNADCFREIYRQRFMNLVVVGPYSKLKTLFLQLQYFYQYCCRAV